ncbi:MAG TPA: SAM-dependent methyltransferase [Thermoanaerobaculia bacterium]|nr:SAM-dependent methyltransferase [Thermoanaerobaculia bacterium]
MAAALYDPDFGYYAAPRSGLDYATSVDISPVFAFSLARLAERFVAGAGDEVCTIVDIGCGDGSLIAAMRDALPEAALQRAHLAGVDRSLERLRPELAEGIEFARSIAEIATSGPLLAVSNELFDAFPFARVVMRERGLFELMVTVSEEGLDWDERPAGGEVRQYFADRGIELATGQFADIALEWGKFYGDLAGRIERGMIVTIDYGFPENRLFDARSRRWGTAVAFSGHQMTRDLLAEPGLRDITAHVNFSDLQREGERRGWKTDRFERQASFLLAQGAADHPLVAPLDEITVTNVEEAAALAEKREAARRLILPDGIGDEMRVLVQSKGIDGESVLRSSSPFSDGHSQR